MRQGEGMRRQPWVENSARAALEESAGGESQSDSQGRGGTARGEEADIVPQATYVPAQDRMQYEEILQAEVPETCSWYRTLASAYSLCKDMPMEEGLPSLSELLWFQFCMSLVNPEETGRGGAIDQHVQDIVANNGTANVSFSAEFEVEGTISITIRATEAAATVMAAIRAAAPEEVMMQRAILEVAPRADRTGE